jgi:hypothetical protein
VPERKSHFSKKTAQNQESLFLKIFSAQEKNDSFPDLLATIRNYSYKLQIVGTPSLWIIFRLLSKKRQAARFCFSANTRCSAPCRV